MGQAKSNSNQLRNSSNSFSHKDGFFELPYLVNSPELMIENFKKMDFIKSNNTKQFISTKTPYLDVEVYYRKVENGLFLIYSEVNFKSNVCFRHSQDNSITPNYYCLSLRIDHYTKINNSLANGISYTDNSWLIFKPNAKVNHHHFKGTKGRYLSVYFTPQWIKKQLNKASLNDKKLLELFFKSSSDHLICPNLSKQSLYNTNKLSKQLKSGDPESKSHLQLLRNEIQHFFSCFISKMESENINKHHFQISNLDRIKILKADKVIEMHLYKKFPGIEYIAKEVGLSGTKLKECFKIIYNETLFQYFRNRQMEKAIENISKTNISIGQIARKLGYENASKFAIAFKSRHSMLPSEVKRLS